NQTHRLSVPIAMQHAEVTGDILARVPPLLVADDHDPQIFESAEPADNRRVVAVEAIAVELDEVLEEELDEVAGVRALRMARELRALPGGQARVGTLAHAGEALLELPPLLARL